MQLTPKRILLDISHTIKSRHSSGIQMVVRKLAEILPRLATNGQIECRPMIYRQGRFWTTRSPADECIATFEQTRDQFLSALSRIPWATTKDTHDRDVSSDRPVLRQSADDSGLGLWRTPLNAYWKLNRFSVRKFGFRDRLEFSEGDFVLLPDGYWSLMEIWDSVNEAKNSGATVACILYDLVCMTNPEFVTERMRASFARYLDKVTESADLIMTISRDVKNQLERLAQNGQFAHPLPPVDHFHLGADSHRIVAPPRRDLEQVLTSDPRPYVMIATLEPRKNHAYVLDAFDKLWQQSSTAKLILAGRNGWDCEHIMQRVRTHPRYGKQLFLFHDLTNNEIAHCYENARGVILASHSEGFGLPVVEGQWHGRRVFASEIPVHREVGLDCCEYFDLSDSSSLTRALQVSEASDDDRPLTSKRPDTWEESISNLILKLIDFSRQEKHVQTPVRTRPVAA